MTGPSVRASLRFVAEACRPGSIEARHIHGCTCTADPDRQRVWNPDQAAPWQDTLNLDCPAHGRLFERFLARRAHVRAELGGTQAAGLAADVERLGRPLPRRERPGYRRSLRQRWADAWRGFWAGWRGVA